MGIGFHNAAMETEDRALVEGLFRDAVVMVLVSKGVGGFGNANRGPVSSVNSADVAGALEMYVLGLR